MIMKFTMLYTAALFFVGVNVKKCEEIHTEDSTTTAATDKDATSTPLQETHPVLSNHIPTKDSNTLPPTIFTPYLADLLSPKIFSQPNLLEYFLDSTTKLSDRDFRTQLFNVGFLLNEREFPKRYTLYAEILSSILQCQVRLQSIVGYICKIGAATASHDLPPPIPDIPLTDDTAALHALFSPDIFSDINPPSRLLIKLVELPESRLANVAVQLSDLSENKELPSQYYWYTKFLYLFIKYYRNLWLRDLRRGLAKLQRKRKVKSSILGEFSK